MLLELLATLIGVEPNLFPKNREFFGFWLGREDSNLWMTGPKPVALPLGDSPKYYKFVPL